MLLYKSYSNITVLKQCTVYVPQKQYTHTQQQSSTAADSGCTSCIM